MVELYWLPRIEQWRERLRRLVAVIAAVPMPGPIDATAIGDFPAAVVRRSGNLTGHRRFSGHPYDNY
jgi:hypothetical protein